MILEKGLGSFGIKIEKEGQFIVFLLYFGMTGMPSVCGESPRRA